MQRKIVGLLFYGIFYFLSVLVGLYPAVLSGSSKIPFELGDFRLCQYFLEHTWQWIHNANYTGELYSPSFFFPYKNALTFSENLFGVAPIYWLLRVFSGPDIAVLGWIGVISGLNFGAMTFVLRREKVRPFLAAFGGFLFAFPMMRVVQLAHMQLLPQFCTPMALWQTWRFLRQPTIPRLCWILLLVYWQLLCGIYLGWFLLLVLAVMVMVAIVASKSIRSKFLSFLRSSWAGAIVITGLWLGGAYVFLAPYLETKHLMGGHSYESMVAYIPKLNSWVLVPPLYSFWSDVLGHLDRGLPVPYEHNLFLGLVGTVAVGGGILYCLGKPGSVEAKGVEMGRRQMIGIFLLTGFMVVLLSWNISEGLSLWWFMYRFVPGGSAIRGVSRIALATLPCFLIAGLLWLDLWVEQFKDRRALQTGLLVAIVTFGMLEQRLYWPDVPALEAARRQAKIEHVELSQSLKQYCQVAYVSPLNPPSATPTPPIEIIYHQIAAMWAGLDTNIPVVNGYSGLAPPGFSMDWDGREKIILWLRAQRSPRIDRLCFVRRKGTNAVTTAGTEGLERHQSEHYSLEVMRYP
jgi:hypothetical protein